MMARTKNFKTYKMSFPELLYNISSQEETFIASIETIYPTKSQKSIQTMLNYLVSKFFRQYPFITIEHAQNLHISKMSVPELPSNIYLP